MKKVLIAGSFVALLALAACSSSNTTGSVLPVDQGTAVSSESALPPEGTGEASSESSVVTDGGAAAPSAASSADAPAAQ